MVRKTTSARTSTKSARPPTISIVSGEVACSREMAASGAPDACLNVRSPCRLRLGLGPRLRLGRLAPLNGAYAPCGGRRRLGHTGHERRRRRRDGGRRGSCRRCGWRRRGRRDARSRSLRLPIRGRRRLGSRRRRLGRGRLRGRVLRERRIRRNQGGAAHREEYRCLPQQRSSRARHVAVPQRPTTVGFRPSAPSSQWPTTASRWLILPFRAFFATIYEHFYGKITANEGSIFL